MSKIDTQKMQQRLLALRAELEQATQIGEDSAAVVELDQSKVGRLSRMDAMQAQAMAKASGLRREQTLSRITMALRRIEADDYGDCSTCDEPIDPKRLQFDPAATLCIACASRSEQ